MIRILKKLTKFIDKPQYTTPLGRWGGDTKNMTEFNSLMSNHDHCGDELCKISILMENKKEKKEIDSQNHSLNSVSVNM